MGAGPCLLIARAQDPPKSWRILATKPNWVHPESPSEKRFHRHDRLSFMACWKNPTVQKAAASAYMGNKNKNTPSALRS